MLCNTNNYESKQRMMSYNFPDFSGLRPWVRRSESTEATYIRYRQSKEDVSRGGPLEEVKQRKTSWLSSYRSLLFPQWVVFF